MLNIDFLPAEYRQRVRQRQSQLWRIVVAAAMIVLVAAAAITQHCHRRRVRADLAEVTPAYAAAVALQSRLTDVQRQLDQARACAELYTYLRHPWPRTQLLVAIIEPLPDEITLQRVQILREPADARPPVEGKPQEAAIASLLPAQRDLAKLRDRMDPTRTIMILTGTAAGSSTLHRYLGELDATEIFESAELKRFESVAGGRSLRFQVVLGVQPGYGQLGGPAGPDTKPRPLVAPTRQPAGTGRLPVPRRKPMMTRAAFPRIQVNWIVTALPTAIAVVYLGLIWLPGYLAITAVQDQVQSQRQFVVQAGDLPTMLANCQRELDAAESAVARWEKAAPRKRRLAAYFEKIDDVAREAGLTVARFAPQPVRCPREDSRDSSGDRLFGRVRPSLRVSEEGRAAAGHHLD